MQGSLGTVVSRWAPVCPAQLHYHGRKGDHGLVNSWHSPLCYGTFNTDFTGSIYCSSGIYYALHFFILIFNWTWKVVSFTIPKLRYSVSVYPFFFFQDWSCILYKRLAGLKTAEMKIYLIFLCIFGFILFYFTQKNADFVSIFLWLWI